MKYLSATQVKNNKLSIHLLRIVLTGLMALVVFALSAQTPMYGEKVFAHLNRNILFNGSILKYSAYITNEHNCELSTIIYFDLTKSDGTQQIGWEQKATKGFATGAFEIPDSLKNGTYLFRAYTHCMLNYPSQSIFSVPVVIQKLHEKTNDTLPFTLNASEHNQIDNLTDYLNISIKPGQTPEIKLSKTEKCNIARVSISISEKLPMEQPALMPTFTSYLDQTKSIVIKPEEDIKESGFYVVSGELYNPAQKEPIAKQTVFLSYPDSSVHFKYDITDEQGRFCFFLDSNFDNRLILLQVNNHSCDSNSVQWKLNSKHIAPMQVDQSDYIYNMSEQYYYEQLQKRELIDRVYNTKPIVKADIKQPASLPDFYYEADYTVRPDEYADLNDFREIIENLLLMVRYKNINKTMQLGMVLKESPNVLYDNVFCFIDGVPCFNMDYVAKLNSNDIDHIDVVNSILMYGDITINGLIAIYTHHGSFDKNAFCTPFYSLNNELNPVKISENTDKGLPNTLPDAFWLPDLIINESPVTITPRRIEIGSDYIITINGLVNGIIPVSYQQSLKVK